MVPSPPEVGRWRRCKTGTAMANQTIHGQGPPSPATLRFRLAHARDLQEPVGRHRYQDRQRTESRPRPERQRRQRLSADSPESVLSGRRLWKTVAFVARASLFPCAGEADESEQAARASLVCDSTGLKIKEETKTENRAFLTARCHNEGRFSREVSGQDRPQSCRRNSPANLLVRPPLPQQVFPSLGIVRTPEETPAKPIPHAEGRHRATRWPAPALPRRSLGLGRTSSYVEAGRNLEGKGGTSPPQSDGSEWNTGPHIPKRNVRLASAKVAGPFRVGAGGASTSDVGWSHNGPSPAAEPDAFSELDRGPLGGGAAPITASGATAGILSGPHAHSPEPAVSGTVNRAGPVTDRDTRRIFFLIPLDRKS